MHCITFDTTLKSRKNRSWVPVNIMPHVLHFRWLDRLPPSNKSSLRLRIPISATLKQRASGECVWNVGLIVVLLEVGVKLVVKTGPLLAKGKPSLTMLAPTKERRNCSPSQAEEVPLKLKGLSNATWDSTSTRKGSSKFC